MELLVYYQFSDHIAITLTNSKEWDQVQQCLKKLDAGDILLFSNTSIKVKDYINNIVIKNDISYINSFKLLSNKNKSIGIDLVSPILEEDDDEQVWKEISATNAVISDQIKNMVVSDDGK